VNSYFRIFRESIHILTSDFSRKPSAIVTARWIGLVALGIIGNLLNIELFFGVNFLFGSILTMISVRTFGIFGGTLAGIAIGSYTYFLWGHPYAIFIFGLEAFIVGFVVRALKKENMALVDLGYWLVIGMPMV